MREPMRQRAMPLVCGIKQGNSILRYLIYTPVPTLTRPSLSAPNMSDAFLPAPDQLARELSTALPLFNQVQWTEKTVSTNGDLLARARSVGGPLARPWLLGAHLQESGRGRAGRTWQNRSGANLMFSCAFDVFLPPARLATLSPYAGLVATETLRGLLTASNRPLLTMKWPNDRSE